MAVGFDLHMAASDRVLVVAEVACVRIDAANTSIQNSKRTAVGFSDAKNYKTRILLGSAARRAA